MNDTPRYAPDTSFPPYSYVCGEFPHPESDPNGHSHGHERPTADPIDQTNWQENVTYLAAIDLFNHGYYWEAHESWESLWHAVGRTGAIASFLKGLIRLAAAGVKVREERPVGVNNHAKRAAELFDEANKELGDPGSILGLNPHELIDHANATREHPPSRKQPKGTPVEVVLDFRLEVRDHD
ncbi:MAG: DUF309 domain-containing protein [Gemmataceae bacterium]